MKWTCAKSAFKLAGLSLILPICYVYEHINNLEFMKLLTILTVIIWIITLACNNFRLQINEKELFLERVIGRDLYLDMDKVWKIIFLSRSEKKELWLYSWNGCHHFSIISFDTEQIENYLEKLAKAKHIIYIKQNEENQDIWV